MGKNWFGKIASRSFSEDKDKKVHAKAQLISKMHGLNLLGRSSSKNTQTQTHTDTHTHTQSHTLLHGTILNAFL